MSESWLVLETSGRVGKLGLARDGTIVRSRRLEETRRLARDLAPTVSELLAEEVLQPKEITGVMVSIGPGSYTGLRVGITSAKSFAYATGCKLIAVPTFAAIALQAPNEARDVWVIADALQGMIYIQRSSRVGSSPLDELRIDRAEAMLPQLPGEAWITGPGLAVHAKWLPANARVASEVDFEPNVESVLCAGLSLSPVSREELFALEPLYLRGSSAEEKAKANEPRG